MQLLRLALLLLFATYIVSCGSQKKLFVNYIDNTDSTALNDTVKISEIKIQKTIYYQYKSTAAVLILL